MLRSEATKTKVFGDRTYFSKRWTRLGPKKINVHFWLVFRTNSCFYDYIFVFQSDIFSSTWITLEKTKESTFWFLNHFFRHFYLTSAISVSDQVLPPSTSNTNNTSHDIIRISCNIASNGEEPINQSSDNVGDSINSAGSDARVNGSDDRWNIEGFGRLTSDDVENLYGSISSSRLSEVCNVQLRHAKWSYKSQELDTLEKIQKLRRTAT